MIDIQKKLKLSLVFSVEDRAAGVSGKSMGPWLRRDCSHT